MSAPGTALTRLYPGATTAIVVGSAAADPAPDLRGCRAVLWCHTSPAPHPTLALPAGAKLFPLPLAQAEPAALEQFLRLDARHLPSLHVQPAALADPAYQPLLARLTTLLAEHHRARVTRQQDGYRWQSHLLQNLPAYATHRLPENWRGALAGHPAFVCGAGPSLDISAPRLAAAAERGVVFAADSALRTLARHGVAADFVVSIDVAKLPEKCLPATHHPARAVLSSVSPPAWHHALPGATPVYVANRQITLDWLDTLGLARPPLAATESCGSTALDLARFLGCAPIYLFGLDLALTSTQRHTTSADASIYTHSGFDASQEHPRIPGNYAATVPSHAAGDWHALDARLATWPAGLVHNVNDRGARLGNTTLVPTATFTCTVPALPKASLLAALPAPTPPDAAVLARAFIQVQDAGRRVHEALPAVRGAFTRGGPASAAEALRGLFADRTIGRALGGFALKLMPHLLPPTEGDPATWQIYIDELAALAALAQTVR